MSGGLLAVVIKHGKRNGSLTILNNFIISLNILTPLVDEDFLVDIDNQEVLQKIQEIVKKI